MEDQKQSRAETHNASAPSKGNIINVAGGTNHFTIIEHQSNAQEVAKDLINLRVIEDRNKQVMTATAMDIVVPLVKMLEDFGRKQMDKKPETYEEVVNDLKKRKQSFSVVETKTGKKVVLTFAKNKK